MIKINKENDTKVVTQGAYKNYYEHLGYKIVSDKKSINKEVEPKKEIENKKEVENKGAKETYLRK